MVRKQGGLLHANFAANENVVERCLAEVKKVEPSSLADKLYHITIKAAAYTEFFMDGFEYTTDGLSIALGGTNTAEIREVKFKTPVNDCIICFIY